ncbi:MAG: fibronectin type III domain-containing protein [Euryarchaeota archaeon]|nr:fibronectin type III domain-containing protein [Euryarchaeota archaeon]
MMRLRWSVPTIGLLAILLLASGAAAQEEDLKDPTCAEDPDQMGCEGSTGDHPPCPTNLAGYAPETGGVFMSYQLNSFSDVKIYRSVDGGEMEEIAYKEFPTPRFIDHDTEPGKTYTYGVTAVGMHQYDENVTAEGESPMCGTIEVTTVPFFPSAMTAVLVSGIAVVGYVAMRRK